VLAMEFLFPAVFFNFHCAAFLFYQTHLRKNKKHNPTALLLFFLGYNIRKNRKLMVRRLTWKKT